MGKQRIPIYTIRPAAPNQALRQRRSSRRGNVPQLQYMSNQRHSGWRCTYVRAYLCVWKGDERRGESVYRGVQYSRRKIQTCETQQIKYLMICFDLKKLYIYYNTS